MSSKYSSNWFLTHIYWIQTPLPVHTVIPSLMATSKRRRKRESRWRWIPENCRCPKWVRNVSRVPSVVDCPPNNFGWDCAKICQVQFSEGEDFHAYGFQVMTSSWSFPLPLYSQSGLLITCTIRSVQPGFSLLQRWTFVILLSRQRCYCQTWCIASKIQICDNSSDILITHSKAAPVYLQATGLQQSVSPWWIKPSCLWSHSEVTGRHFKLILLGWQFIWRDSDLQWKKQVGTNSSAANQCEEYLRAILD